MLKLNQQIISRLNGDALRTFPDECCGFILGHETGNEKTAIDLVIVDNAKEGDKRRRFEISASDYVQAEKFCDENGLVLLGIYHSHPNYPSVPSEHDRVAAQPFFSYLIISVIENKIASYQSWVLNEDFQFEQETISIDEPINIL